MDQNVLLHQLIEDMSRLHQLIVRVATGERHLTKERDQLQNTVDVKMALLGAMSRSDKPPLIPEK